jgi:hypothetical protein
MGLLVPFVVGMEEIDFSLIGVVVMAICAVIPFMLPKFPARQLAVVNIPLTMICFYLM